MQKPTPRDIHMAISENGAWVQDFLTKAVRAGFRPKADTNLSFSSLTIFKLT